MRYTAEPYVVKAPKGKCALRFKMGKPVESRKAVGGSCWLDSGLEVRCGKGMN